MVAVETCAKEAFQHPCVGSLSVDQCDIVDAWRSFEDSVAIYVPDGFLLAQTVSDECLIHLIFVSPLHRMNGLGRAMVDYLKKQVGVITAFVFDNTAREFWTAMEFEPFSFFHYGWAMDGSRGRRTRGENISTEKSKHAITC